MTEVEGFLHLLKAEPTLLPPAPADEPWRAIDHRTSDELHSCLRCGARAQVAFVAATKLGPRWLDLCAECTYWLKAESDQTT